MMRKSIVAIAAAVSMIACQDVEEPPHAEVPGIHIDLSDGYGFYQSEEETMRFPIAYGAGGHGKHRQGDWKTPVGDFYIMEKHISSEYCRFLGISYPARNDASRGVTEGLITEEQRDRIEKRLDAGGIPPQTTALGGYIGIHGGKRLALGPLEYELTTEVNWTQGCIATTDENVERLYKSVPVGTPVHIQE